MLTVAIRRNLRDFTLETEFGVRKGETFVLIGENGSGKSSLLLLISGLLFPESGHISLGERVLYDSLNGFNVPAEERDIGFVFQNYAIFPHLTVFENVAFGLRRRKVPASEIRARVEENLALLSLENLSSVRADQLSGENARGRLLHEPLSSPRHSSSWMSRSVPLMQWHRNGCAPRFAPT